MDTISDQAAGRRRRRTHSDEFKVRTVGACRQPGVSIAAVAMANGLNANLLRRWVFDAEHAAGATGALQTVPSRSTTASAPTPGFVPMQLSAGASTPLDIRIELRRGGTAITVTWPTSAAPECAAWMKELLR